MGRVEMDSISEVVKLGYSSILKDKKLLTWIVEHDYLSDLQTEYFQILCHNCNFAKGIKRNNHICPHEIMRKEETFARMEEQSSFEAGF